MIKIIPEINWLLQQAESIPDSTAVESEKTKLTFKELYDQTLKVSNQLNTIGIKNNDYVGLLFSNTVDFIITINALWQLGAIPVPLNIRLGNNEIEKQIEFVSLKFLLIEDVGSQYFYGLNFTNKYFISDLPSVVNRNIGNPNKFKESDTALVLFTSGSVSEPKAVELTFANFYYSAAAANNEINFNAADSLLASLPFYHIGGFSIITRAVITGLPIILPYSPKPDDVYSAIQKFRPSIISIVPTTLKRFLDLNYLPDENLRCVFLGGGPINKSITKKALSIGWKLFIVYGSTETCSMVTILKTNEIIDRLECAGKPIADNRIFIIGSNGEYLPPYSEGNVVVKSKSVMKGFLNIISDREHSDEYFSDDIGFLDNDGYLFITGRSDDIIISGGENINCREVDKHVLTFPDIDECYCFGLEDNEWGQILCAAIVVGNHRKYNEANLIKFLKSRLASFKIPKRYFVLGSIPKNDLGKVNKKKLLKSINPN